MHRADYKQTPDIYPIDESLILGKVNNPNVLVEVDRLNGVAVSLIHATLPANVTVELKNQNDAVIRTITVPAGTGAIATELSRDELKATSTLAVYYADDKGPDGTLQVALAPLVVD